MSFGSEVTDSRISMLIPYDGKRAAHDLALELLFHFRHVANRPIVFVCIGTDRSIGDSLGPLVGTFLEEKRIQSFYIYGTIDDPIHSLNLDEKLEYIQKKHDNPFIIGIDACLGRYKNIGNLEIGDGPVNPGSGVNKELTPVGHIHITGTVNIGGFMEIVVLQNTRLNLVFRMAQTIAQGIYKANLYYPQKSEWLKFHRSSKKQKI